MDGAGSRHAEEGNDQFPRRLVGEGLFLDLLDGPRLTVGPDIVHVPVRSQRLVAFLGLRGAQPRTLIAGMLWPEAPEERARASLRAAVRDLTAKLPALLLVHPSQVSLARDVHVDVLRFRQVAHALLRPTPSEDAVTAGLALVPGGALGGSLLPGWHDDWAVAEAERLDQLRLHALDALVGRLLDRPDPAQALQVALAAAAIDPLRESTHRTVMRVYLAEGNPVDALRLYERFRTTLRVAMGIEPTRRMLDLVEQIQRTDLVQVARGHA
jgi:DNA-binding SARP family transcriptional activator